MPCSWLGAPSRPRGITDKRITAGAYGALDQPGPPLATPGSRAGNGRGRGAFGAQSLLGSPAHRCSTLRATPDQPPGPGDGFTYCDLTLS